MIVIVSPNKNGKIELTKEQLQEYLEQAKAEGAKEAQKNNFIYTQPTVTPSLQPDPLLGYRFTCTSNNPENEIIAISQKRGSGNL